MLTPRGRGQLEMERTNVPDDDPVWQEVTYQPRPAQACDPLLGKVVTPADVPAYDVAETSGNPHDQGLFWRLCGPGVNGAPEFDLGLYRLEPDQFHPPHYHPTGPEFYFIAEGSCLVLVEDEWREVGPGTTIYFPEGAVHAVRTRADESVAIFYGFDIGEKGSFTTVWVE